VTVDNQVFQIIFVSLRQQAVKKFPSHLTSIPNQLNVIGCHEHDRVFSNVCGELCALLIILADDLFLALLEGTYHAMGLSFSCEFTPDQKMIFPRQDGLLIGGVDGAFGER